MKAIAYIPGSASSDPRSFFETEKPEPILAAHDLLVSVRAVSVNPVDTKVRDGRVFLGDAIDVLGWDIAGVVVAIGPEVTLFRPGDEVFYSGSLYRSGGNAELHAVDERLVGRKPASLTFAKAAALPLTSLTAWELLFERLNVRPGKSFDAGAILIVGGAGGVGSMLIQFVRRLTGLRVIATASRPESRDWSLSLGAHAVIDHSKSMADELRAIQAPTITHIAALNETDRHWPAITEIIAPGGKVGVITNHDSLDVTPLRAKSASLHWEDVVTRTAFGAPADLISHHRILEEVSSLADAGVIRSTATKELRPISAASLAEAHALVESGRMLGKVVIGDFPS
ncbi:MULTISPECIES: zinc-binding alcohol dehydrogenase family protein [unclassified Bradyrhizobium]|uniref:zinc-binding alcohol dehydrogenase family protein n=1 Tax=unclassified Bradyrhizobium TaxID=2631580 RepID=UPI001FFBE785|nr:zinc-binding alcohol dehydrogenase family protein [Bradyrhizobium sp. 48]MCK1441492.1 zinc-binding alcohol dehydrogenase family protein [Bradyrhizobium sp. 48]